MFKYLLRGTLVPLLLASAIACAASSGNDEIGYECCYLNRMCSSCGCDDTVKSTALNGNESACSDLDGHWHTNCDLHDAKGRAAETCSQ